tara:strand:+ start:880 stop:2622 length:1743 start_codon:yes stop_codon:yes gene_type:complete
MSTQTKATAIQKFRDALALHDAGQVVDARSIYHSLTSQLSNLAAFWHFYGLAQFQTGDLKCAAACFKRALLLTPDDANCINRFACIFLTENRANDARHHLLHALAAVPVHPEAWKNLAEAERLNDDPASERELLEKALALRPDEMTWRMSYVSVLNDLEQPGEALAALRPLTGVKELAPVYFFQEARAHYDAFEASQAISSYRKSLLLSPAAPTALNNLQLVERRTRRMQEAVRSAERARLFDPGNPDLEHNFTDALLAAGEIERGQARNFWRHSKAEIRIERIGLPKAWDGTPCADGKGLLICQEQGIGDEIRFASCIPDILHRFRGPVVLEADKRLVPLFARSFPELTVIEKIARSETVPSTADYSGSVATLQIGQHVMLADLPNHVRTSIADFPTHAGYLVPDSDEVRHWKNSFSANTDQQTVGFCWRSGMRRQGARHNYPDAAEIASLMKVGNFLPVCLQYDVSDSEIAVIQASSNRQLCLPQGIDQREELDRLAAMIAALDLVISPNTSVLMVAGAVGTASIGLHSQCGAIFFGADADPWFPNECSLIKNGDRSWRPAVDEAIPHLIRMLEQAGR